MPHLRRKPVSPQQKPRRAARINRHQPAPNPRADRHIKQPLDRTARLSRNPPRPEPKLPHRRHISIVPRRHRQPIAFLPNPLQRHPVQRHQIRRLIQNPALRIHRPRHRQPDPENPPLPVL